MMAIQASGRPIASGLASRALRIRATATTVGGAWVAGWLVRRRAAQARLAVAASGELARSAVVDERARIARDLHDIVAHSVSIIAVQAGAAEALLERDPAAAREHLAALRRTARETMNEMRRLLGVLREDQPSYAPQPSLSRLEDLLVETRGAGVPVELIEEGRRPPLSAGVDLVAYRIVQESLTNVRKHAGRVPTRVEIHYGMRDLELEICNEPGALPRSHNGRTEEGGHGLIGMRERAEIFGGTLEAGERGSGGFRVHAVLPLEDLG
jgi:signal transduction histidine kinase